MKSSPVLSEQPPDPVAEPIGDLPPVRACCGRVFSKLQGRSPSVAAGIAVRLGILAVLGSFFDLNAQEHAIQDLDRSSTVTGYLNGDASESKTWAFIADYGASGAAPSAVALMAPSAVASMVRSWKPDFIVTGGDNNYGSLAPITGAWTDSIGLRYGEFMMARADGRYPFCTSQTQRFFPCRGNHDSDTGGYADSWGGTIDGFLDFFHDNPGGVGRLPVGSGGITSTAPQRCYYDFVQGAGHFFVIDSDAVMGGDTQAADIQKTWLRNGIAASTARWKFLIVHGPPYSSGQYRPGLPELRWPEAWAGASAIFCGHEHIYERHDLTSIDPEHLAGLPQFTCGLGGSGTYFFDSPVPTTRFQFDKAWGALKVSMSATGAIVEFRRTGRQLQAVERGGYVEDLYGMGDTQSVFHPDETHGFTSYAGRRLTITTETPDGSLLDPRIELISIDETKADPDWVVAAASGGMPDGRNARLVYTPYSGQHYRVKVIAENGSRGAYRLKVAMADDFHDWQVRHFGAATADGPLGPDGDPDGDGWSNALEFAFKGDPETPAPLAVGIENRDGTVFVDGPRGPEGIGVIYTLESSASLDEGSWVPFYKEFLGGDPSFSYYFHQEYYRLNSFYRWKVQVRQ